MPPIQSIPFRTSVPTRKTWVSVKAQWWSYRADLRDDFNKRCWYCDDTDSFRTISFAIDHFIPRNPKGWTHTILPNHYSNLVYSCHFCNSAKSNKWPTRNPAIYHNWLDGFVDPTTAEYDTLFYRNKNWIILKTGNWPSSYMHRELNLWLPIHSITWMLEKMINMIQELDNLIPNITDPTLKAELEEHSWELQKFAFRLTHNWIFRQND